MISFFICVGILLLGYVFYGKMVDKVFEPDDRETPAVRINDGVDYVVLPQWKLFLVQLLNIAGLGPINGAIAGALWGPIVFLWITFGTIFAGAVHDYFSGMISERHEGKSISEVCGIYLGPLMQGIMRLFCVILLVMVGTVFAVGPARLIATLIKSANIVTIDEYMSLITNNVFWVGLILLYYFIATFVPVDKVIGKVYPLFGICLITMAVGVIFGIVINPVYRTQVPELFTHFYNMHPSNVPIWPFMFVTVACGAISGFHSTQSPIMARCIKKEKQGRFVFYGAMVAEAIIALVWGTAGITFYPMITDMKSAGIIEWSYSGNPETVYFICKSTLGGIGIVLAMLGVIACPITSGDTAFRSARLTLADWFKMDQKNIGKRLILCIPVLGAGAFLGIGNAIDRIDYEVIWRYFSWTNQTLAMIVLWTASMYLAKQRKNFFITAVPATFMSAVSVTYFICAEECLGGLIFMHEVDGKSVLDMARATNTAYPIGIIVATIFLGFFLYAESKQRKVATARETNKRKNDFKGIW